MSSAIDMEDMPLLIKEPIEPSARGVFIFGLWSREERGDEWGEHGWNLARLNIASELNKISTLNLSSRQLYKIPGEN